MTDDANADQQSRPLLPFYLVVDVSYSMKGPKLDAANEICPDVATAVATNPLMQDKTRFGVITFSDKASVVLPISDLSTISQLPVFRIEGGTSFKAAFNLLKSTIEKDVATLKGDNFLVHRPAVFFVTDGEPTDKEKEWKSAHTQLTSSDASPYYPNLIPFGVDGARPDNIAYIAHPAGRFKGYLQGDGASAAEAIQRIAEIVVSSVISSAESMSDNTDPTDAIVAAIDDHVESSNGAIKPVGDFL